MTDKLEEMRCVLRAELQEWLGFDIPSKGSEDHETWVSRSEMIEELQSYSDVYYYLNGDEERVTEFFASFDVKFSVSDL